MRITWKRRASASVFVHFHRHPQKRIRVTCGSSLLKFVKTASGKQISRPLKLFCYPSIIQSFRQLVQQPGMLDILKNSALHSGVMADINDGSVWKSFLTIEGKEC